MKFKYSLIIPCYNEERTVFEVVNEVCKRFTESEVIVVDDLLQSSYVSFDPELVGIYLPKDEIISRTK